MNKAQELLEKMDGEILEKTNLKVMEEDANIKKVAEDAYNSAVEAEIAKIKASVEKEYAVARDYLTQIIEASEPEMEGEKAPEATEAASEGEATPNEPVVLQ